MMRRLADAPLPVADAVQARWPTRGAAWISGVGHELRWLCQQYRAEIVRVLPARYSFVVEVDTGRSRLVLRATPDPQARFQAAVMGTLAHVGVGPRIHETVETSTGIWTVADRIAPGISLFDTEVPPGDLARTLKAMRGLEPPMPDELPSLVDWLRDRLNDDNLTDLPPRQRPAPQQQRQRARGILDNLGSTATELCHGDASPGNLLTSDLYGLLLVDPRGMRGEVAYDVAVAALKTAPPGESMKHAAYLARLTAADPERVIAWVDVANAARV